MLYDRDGKTLTVWFTDARNEYICEETGDEIVLMKDSSGRVRNPEMGAGSTENLFESAPIASH